VGLSLNLSEKFLLCDLERFLLGKSSTKVLLLDSTSYGTGFPLILFDLYRASAHPVSLIRIIKRSAFNVLIVARATASQYLDEKLHLEQKLSLKTNIFKFGMSGKEIRIIEVFCIVEAVENTVIR
jgi:hypothetical protein